MRIAGTILAGGRSSRMGADKALATFRGRPLLAHAIARFAPQADPLAINANGDPRRFEPFSLPVIPDRMRGQPGPLAGIAAALDFAQASGADAAAVVPVDAPFFPGDVVLRLTRALEGHAAACVRTARGIEPLFSLWRVELRDAVGAALAAGIGAPRMLLTNAGFVDVSPEEAADFANLNTPDDLFRAEADAARRRSD